MAGEKKGKAYEALVHVALLDLVDARKLEGPLHWNVTPKTMSIEPDFMTGNDPNNPKTVLLLNHSGSSKESEKKMWRNLGELVEAKTVLPDVSRVYCLTFGFIKTDLEPIQQHAFDQFVWVRQATHPWANDLDAFITDCVPNFPKGKDTQTDFMRDNLKNASAKAKSAYQALKSLLETLYKANSVALDKMWADHRARKIPSAPGARNTYVRRGTSKARIFEDINIAYQLYSGLVIDADNVPRYIYDLGFATTLTVNSKGIAKPVDTEIANAVKLLPYNVFSRLVNLLHSDKVTEYVNSLRNLDRYGAIADYVSNEFYNLIDPKNLANVFRDIHNDPNSVNLPSKNPSSWPPNSVWLMEFLFDLVRAHHNSGNSFGIAQLGREVIQAGFGSVADLNSANQFGGGFGLSAWIARKPNSGFKNDLIDGVAHVFSAHLSAMGNTGTRNALLGIRDSAAKSLIEAKLVTYKMYEPLWELIKYGVTGVKKTSISSCFGEAGGSSGRAGHTSLAKKNHTLINWQSCSDAGRDHKKKELCGRAIGVRYHWNGKDFVRRPGIQKMILVLDGTWKQADLNALLRAGWDEIYYPDEMDQLAKAIV